MASNSNKDDKTDGSQPECTCHCGIGWCWAWWGYYSKVMTLSRSGQGSIMFTWDVYSGGDPYRPHNWSIPKHPQEFTREIQRTESNTPSNQPDVTPVWNGSNNTTIIVIFLPRASTSNPMNHNSSTHGDMGWGWASQGCHPKVMTRSYLGLSRVKWGHTGGNSLFLLFLLKFCSLEKSMHGD